jgi:hypothetical protein
MTSEEFSVLRLELKKAPKNGIAGAALRVLMPVFGGDLRDEWDKSREGVARRVEMI